MYVRLYYRGSIIFLILKRRKGTKLKYIPKMYKNKSTIPKSKKYVWVLLSLWVHYMVDDGVDYI